MKHSAEEYGNLPMCRKESDHKQIFNIVKTLLPQGIRSINMKGVNFANGFLGQDGKLYKHEQAYGCTYTLPFRYLEDSAGKCPKFFDFLHQSWGQAEDYDDRINALQEAICVTIFGMGPRFQRAILLEGAAKSGKSQLLSIVKHLVPHEARCACPPDTWGDKFSPVMMHNKILNVCGELPENKMIDGQRFKDIVSGDDIQMQYKNGQLFMDHVFATHWFASNHLPKTQDTSEGFNRRWLVFRFDYPVQPGKRILDYGEIIAMEEREGIAAWAVEALPRLMMQNEYTLPKSHKERVGEMANANNSVRFFVTESQRMKIVPGQQTSEFALHAAYYGFCLGPGACSPFGIRQFRSKMRDMESELKFKIKMVMHPNGASECIYEGIQLNGK
jgi:phage/plasmid-associated DNA primase